MIGRTGPLPTGNAMTRKVVQTWLLDLTRSLEADTRSSLRRLWCSFLTIRYPYQGHVLHRKFRGYHKRCQNDALDARHWQKRNPFPGFADFDYDLCGKLGSSSMTLRVEQQVSSTEDLPKTHSPLPTTVERSEGTIPRPSRIILRLPLIRTEHWSLT